MLSESEFNEARQAMLTAWHRGDLADAQAALGVVLSEGSPAMKAECLFYQGMIAEERGDLSVVLSSWSEALPQASEGSFLRFRIETGLAGLSEREGRSADALEWLRKALDTCCHGDEFAGSKALAGYLRINQEMVEAADQAVFACVVEKSWRVMGLTGAPDAGDWKMTVAKLIEESERRTTEIIEKS